MSNQPEVWLRGPLDNVPWLLQPVAHALLQAREEINTLMKDFPETLLWERPAGLASPAFHLQHLAGVIDRLFTYAAGQQLNHHQLEHLFAEGKQTDGVNVISLVAAFDNQVDVALAILKREHETTLNETREVGRKRLPTTKIGLYFHAAEHTMRHLGQ